MGRHSADAAPGHPGGEAEPPGTASAEPGSRTTISPPIAPAQRNRIIAAIGMTVVGLVLLVFGFLSLTSTDDPPSTASQGTSNSPADSPTTTPATPSVTTTAAASTSPAPPAPPVLPVTVLNNSPNLTAGLATRVAAALEAGGWPIAEVSNYEGTQLPETTAFFTPGNAAEEASARALVAQFPEITGGVQPRFDGLAGTGLTVAAVGDWQP